MKIVINWMFAISSLLLIVSCGGSDRSDGSGPQLENQAPIANAGTDQKVNELTVVTLLSLSSDPDGSIASYNWTQINGTNVVLTNATSANATFTAPDSASEATLTFELTVTDNRGATSKDTVAVTVADLVFADDINGLWQAGNGEGLLSVGRNSISIYAKESLASCWNQSIYNINQQSNGLYTVSEALTGEEIEISLTYEQSVLTYKKGIHSESYISSSTGQVATTELCPSLVDKTIRVEISLQKLPELIKKLNDASPASAFRWQIFFDVNHSDVYDTGDMTFLLWHNRASGDRAIAEEVVTIDSVSPRFYFAFERNAGVGSGIGMAKNIGLVSIEGNKIILTFDSQTNPMVRYITETTPLKVTTQIRHLAEDNGLYADMNLSDHGPWNWTSLWHDDAYPDPIRESTLVSGFASSTNAEVHYDTLDDQQGESLWIDIDNFKVTVQNH